MIYKLFKYQTLPKTNVLTNNVFRKKKKKKTFNHLSNALLQKGWITAPHYRNLHCKKKRTYNIKALYDCNSVTNFSNCTLSDVEWHSCKIDDNIWNNYNISEFTRKWKFCHHLSPSCLFKWLSSVEQFLFLFSFFHTMEVKLVTNILKSNFVFFTEESHSSLTKFDRTTENYPYKHVIFKIEISF